MSQAGAPPAPSRVRVIRPQFYRSATTGSLPADVRDALIGLMTLADDEGWLLWSLDELATTIYPYDPPKRRLRDLERRTQRLATAGLLVIEACGCALLPSLKEHHGIKGGRQTTPIWSWHMRHAVEGRVRTSPDGDVPSSLAASSSSSASVNGSATSSSPAREKGTPAVCLDCRRPTSVHAADCSILRNPALAQVAG